MQRTARVALGLLPTLWSAIVAGQTPTASPFDGKWVVVLFCPKSSDGALPFTWQFAAEVTGSVLHGEHGDAGQPGWMALDGRIGPDGSAHFQAQGMTGQSAYNINHTARGVPFRYEVTAHFDTARGTGSWMTSRTCNFSFTRQ